MTKYGYFFWLTLLTLLIIAGLLYGAILGNVIALALLVILATVALIALGAGLTLLVNAVATRREQNAFTANAQENLAIIQQLQTLQNAQNSQLLKQQAQNQTKLPAPEPIDALIIDEALFEEL